MKNPQANRLKELRDKQGWNLDHVAQLMGLTPSSICQYEHGVRALNSKRAKQFAEIYGVSTDYILGLAPEDTPFDKARSIQVEIRENPHLHELYEIAKRSKPAYVHAAIAMLETLEKESAAC